MIKAIFSNIKNECRYLEKWIEYHIKLGINKFIFYEEPSNISHESIINKYKDVVDIDYYDYLFKNDINEEEKSIRCLKHIFENYNDIGWLVNLNPAEYIILEEGVTIDDILYNTKEEISQIHLNYKFYNSSGFINQPYNSKYSLLETYLVSIDKENFGTYFNTKVSGKVDNLSSGKCIIKYDKLYSLYKENPNTALSNLYPEFYITPDDSNTIYSKYYINYYITKSFEEFYFRLHEFNEEDCIGDFFILNPDMIEKIPEIENKLHINIF